MSRVPGSWSRVWECWSWCWRVKLPNKRTDQIQTSEQLSSRQLEFCNDSSDFTLSKHVYLITLAIPRNVIHSCPSPSIIATSWTQHKHYIPEFGGCQIPILLSYKAIGLIQSPGRGNEATVVPVTGMTSMERRFQLQESGAKIIIRKQTTWSPHISDYLQYGTR